jgi:hypothetical protein
LSLLLPPAFAVAGDSETSNVSVSKTDGFTSIQTQGLIGPERSNNEDG